MNIRRLTENDAASLWELRLRALTTDPAAFAESAEDFRKTTVEEYAARLRTGGSYNFVFGAFDAQELIGMAGFYRDQSLKLNHKGHIWGVFVSPTARGTGVGRALIEAIISEAKTIPALTCIVLKVARSQAAARHLYETLGFRSCDTEPCSLKIVDEDHMILGFPAA